MPKPTLALSIQQPWAYAILYLGKDVENRTWSTQIRGRIVIHAGKKTDHEGLTLLRAEGHIIPDDLPTGAFLGEVDITGCDYDPEIFGKTRSPWAVGPYCFTLANPKAYAEPVPGKGSLGFFKAPEGVSL